jgi:SAM-dependent methyltransferase
MRRKLLELLVCTGCSAKLDCLITEADGEEISAGILTCLQCSKKYPIARGIPRFVGDDDYASSFGYQWNLFRSEQIDSLNATRLSENRFYSETGWTPEWLKGKWILDAGCGAGRFLDIASQTDCEVVGVDISSAVDAAAATIGDRPNVHIVQASLYELPFRPGAFDGCYCIGVIQHTPDPEKSVRSLPRLLKPGGRIAVTIYEHRRWTKLNAKYLIRPFTKRLSKKTLLFTVKGLMPLLFPITEVAFRIPYAGRLFMHSIPVANYVHESELTIGQRYRWAVLDTFDMWSPKYDQPQKEAEVTKALVAEGIENVQRLPNPGLNLIGQKTGKTQLLAGITRNSHSNTRGSRE